MSGNKPVQQERLKRVRRGLVLFKQGKLDAHWGALVLDDLMKLGLHMYQGGRPRIPRVTSLWHSGKQAGL